MFQPPNELYVEWEPPTKHGYYLKGTGKGTVYNWRLIPGPPPKNFTGSVVWVCFDTCNGEAWDWDDDKGRCGYLWVDRTRAEALKRWRKHRYTAKYHPVSRPVQYFVYRPS